MLDQLTGHRFARHDVADPYVRHLDHPLADLVAERGNPVNDHHRDPHQGEFHGYGTGDRDGRVAGDHDVVVSARDDADLKSRLLHLEGDVLRAQRRGEREQQLQIRPVPFQELGGLQDVRQQLGDLAFAAPRKEPERAARGVQSEGAQRLLFAHGRAHHVKERVPHEGDRDPRVLVEGDLEWEQHRHPVDDPADAVHAAASPGPDLRADEVEHLDPGPLGYLGQPQVEVGVIDQDEKRGGGGEEPSFQDVEILDDDRQMPQHLHQPHHGHLVGVHQGLDPSLAHAVTTHAEEAG